MRSISRVDTGFLIGVGLLCIATSASAIEYSAPGTPYKIRVFNTLTGEKVCVTRRNSCDLPAGEYYVKLIDEDGIQVGRIDGVVLRDGGMAGGDTGGEVASIEDLLSGLGCEPGQKIAATSTDDWSCISTCPASIQSLWTYVTNPELFTPPNDEEVASSSSSVIFSVPETFGSTSLSHRLPGECAVSVNNFYYDVGGDGVSTVMVASGGYTFLATIPESAVTVSYSNDIGGFVPPKVFPIEDTATIKACAKMFGCPSSF